MAKTELQKEYEERKRIAKEEKEKNKKRDITGKDIVTITISILALVFSAATAYFNVLREMENLEATISDGPSLTYGKKEDFSIGGHVELGFVNNGSRSIAVVDATLLLNQSVANAEDEQCFGTYTHNLSFQMEAFVIEPSKVMLKRFNLKEGDIPLLKRRARVGNEEYLRVNGCVQMRIISSQGGEIVTDYFGTWTLEWNRKDQTARDKDVGSYPSPVRRIPMVFLNRSGIRFWSQWYDNVTWRIWMWWNGQQP